MNQEWDSILPRLGAGYLIRAEIGMPRLVIRLRILQPIFASVRWFGRVLAWRLRPMMVLKRNMAVSTKLRRP